MKNFLYFLASFLLAVAVAILVDYQLAQNDDPGYVLIGFGHWSMESTLAVFLVTLIMAFFYSITLLEGWVC